MSQLDSIVSTTNRQPRELRVEWNAAALGLLIGLAFSLSNAFAHVQLPVQDESARDQPQAATQSLTQAAEPQSAPATSERRRNGIPVQFVSDQKDKSDSKPGESPMPRKRRARTPVTGERTLAYWKGLNEIIARETEMRTPPPNVTAANAGAFLASRTKGAKFASQAILKLDARGVDRDLLVHAESLADWYAAEEKLSTRGSFLLEKADVKTRKGAGGNQWKSSEEQHRQKCTELNQHGVELQKKFTEKYELEFPTLL